MIFIGSRKRTERLNIRYTIYECINLYQFDYNCKRGNCPYQYHHRILRDFFIDLACADPEFIQGKSSFCSLKLNNLVQ